MADGHLHELAELAATQWGLITTAQATQLYGVDHLKLLAYNAAGDILRIRHGVYRLPGATTPAPGPVLDEIHAEWLALEPRRTVAERLYDTAPFGMVSHQSAAWMQDLGDFTAAPGDHHHLTLRYRRRGRTATFHVGDVTRSAWHWVDNLPVTRPLRTIADLACAGALADDLAGAACTVLRNGDADPRSLAAALAPHEHRRCRRVGDAVRAFEVLSRSTIS